MKNTIFDIQKDTVSITNVGRVRKNNEDNLGFAETPNGNVFVICDGMGGHVGGQIASDIAVNSIIHYFSSDYKPNILQAMNEAIRLANRNIYNKTIEKPELKGMGTTIVLLVVQDDKIYIGHVGDSRIYLLSDQKLYHLTKDHSYIQNLFDRGILTADELHTHPRKNEITKALGLKPDVEPEIAPEPLKLKNGDLIMMCSDGLSDMVDDHNIHRIMNSNKSVKQIGSELLQQALEGGGKDNITIQLIRISDSNYKQSVFVDKSNTTPIQTTRLSDTLIEDKPIEKPVKKENFKDKLLKNKKILLAALGLLFIVLGALLFFMLKSGNNMEIYKKNKDGYKVIKSDFKDKSEYNKYIDSLKNHNVKNRYYKNDKGEYEKIEKLKQTTPKEQKASNPKNSTNPKNSKGKKADISKNETKGLDKNGSILKNAKPNRLKLYFNKNGNYQKIIIKINTETEEFINKIKKLKPRQNLFFKKGNKYINIKNYKK